MILSPASQTLVGALLGAASLLSVLSYGWVAASTPKATGQLDPESSQRPARPHGVLMLAWAAHLFALVLDISGLGQTVAGARFGFAPALSTTVWLVLAVYMLESRFLPLAGVRRILAVMAALVVVLAFLFPGESRPQAASPWAPIHWVLGLASYGLFGVAVLHAALLSRAERQMRHVKQGAAAGQASRIEPLMPLLRLERLTFQFVGAGVAVLSLAVLLGWWFTPHWHWDHKNLFAVLGWLVLSGLLTGRRVFGWRGRRATRWLYFGALLLLLSYAGSRFVLEVVLQRPL
ncbi:cytochrome C assembly family protein [Roseateles oligotrophus]|uniref:Cytochrome c biogenesis protein CcsA n=1 Tax=Roseateles oligotrophus TaxID=1769250 RepID=A0ABT2YJ19_9BURK|nr:cytochrome c biogenesis protein CcsA [Roseateles oligotrophus]MCV2370033.1 cytochrome c biogenesis protein CcsA [Roseateles oligotrophus]